MPFDPAKPADGSPLNAAEMRSQLTSLQALIAAQASQITALQTALGNLEANTARNPSSVSLLFTSITAPPTQSQVTDILAKLNELITALGHP